LGTHDAFQSWTTSVSGERGILGKGDSLEIKTCSNVCIVREALNKKGRNRGRGEKNREGKHSTREEAETIVSADPKVISLPEGNGSGDTTKRDGRLIGGGRHGEKPKSLEFESRETRRNGKGEKKRKGPNGKSEKVPPASSKRKLENKAGVLVNKRYFRNGRERSNIRKRKPEQERRKGKQNRYRDPEGVVRCQGKEKKKEKILKR